MMLSTQLSAGRQGNFIYVVLMENINYMEIHPIVMKISTRFDKSVFNNIDWYFIFCVLLFNY